MAARADWMPRPAGLEPSQEVMQPSLLHVSRPGQAQPLERGHAHDRTPQTHESHELHVPLRRRGTSPCVTLRCFYAKRLPVTQGRKTSGCGLPLSPRLDRVDARAPSRRRRRTAPHAAGRRTARLTPRPGTAPPSSGRRSPPTEAFGRPEPGGCLSRPEELPSRALGRLLFTVSLRPVEVTHRDAGSPVRRAWPENRLCRRLLRYLERARDRWRALAPYDRAPRRVFSPSAVGCDTESSLQDSRGAELTGDGAGPFACRSASRTACSKEPAEAAHPSGT